MATDVNRNLQELLRDPQETLSTEIKNWLNPSDNEHRALVAKACIALANHGGGHLIIGLTQDGDGYREAEGRPERLDAYTTDWANGIVTRYADPSFHCEVRHIQSPTVGGIFPVLSAPGGHTIPIVAKRSGPGQRIINQGAPYIRRPGPRSEAPQSAQEWQDLMRRCLVNARAEMIDQIRTVLSGEAISHGAPVEGEDTVLRWRDDGLARWREVTAGVPPENPARFPHGFWTIGYQLCGEINRTRGRELIDALRTATVRHTGWPEWWVPGRAGIDPYPHGDSIECWLARDGEVMYDDPAHADFWRAHPEGRMFLARGYTEDANEKEGVEPRSAFSLTTPVWRVGECLLHAHNLASVLAPDDDQADVEVIIQWTGLQGRRLKSFGNRLLMDRWQSNQDVVETRARFNAAQVPVILPEAVQELTLPLYETFAFFQPSGQMFTEELAKMRQNQF